MLENYCHTCQVVLTILSNRSCWRTIVTGDRSCDNIVQVTGRVGELLSHLSPVTILSQVTCRVGELLSQVTGRVGDLLTQVTGRVGELLSQVTGRVGELLSQVTGRVGELLSQVTGRVLLSQVQQVVLENYCHR